MSKHIFKYLGAGCLALSAMFTSCEDFLDRPPEDAPSAVDAYASETQLKVMVDVLYNSPWFDLERALTPIGDGMAGNYYNPNPDGWLPFNMGETSTMSSNAILEGASNTLYSVITHTNMTMANISQFSSCSDEIKNKYIGEAMLMKSMAYFFLARIWGDVIIIGDLEKIIADKGAYDIKRSSRVDVYKFAIVTAIRASELLPETTEAGRLDKYSAYGLLAKMYLTAAGASGSLDNHYLDKAIEYASKVYNNGYHKLEPEFANLFRISTGDKNPEALFALHFKASYSPYTAINMVQCDIAPQGMNGTNSWGGYAGPSVDLQRLFGVDPFDLNCDDADGIRKDPTPDVRRKATMMMYHDYYPNLWRFTTNELGTKGLYLFQMGSKEENGEEIAKYEDFGNMVMNSPTLVQNAKYVWGNPEDHYDECGLYPEGQASCMPIHFLRVADVYLCYAEAALLRNGSVSGEALDAYNAVLNRAGLPSVSSVTFDEIFDQRRKELAFEGDNWYDIVRLSYYDEAKATEKFFAPERGRYENWESGFNYYEFLKGEMKDKDGNLATADYCRENALLSAKASIVPVNQLGEKFVLPYIEADLIANPGLREPSGNFDFSSISYYDESKF